MKPNMKRITAALLALVMLFSMIPAMAATTEVPISRGRTATDRTDTGSGNEFAVDGLPTTRWDGGAVSSKKWLKIDLGKAYNIGYYDILWYTSSESDTRTYRYKIWTNTVDDWDTNTATGNYSTGTYYQAIDRSTNAVSGRVTDVDASSHMARYVAIDGISGTTGNFSIFEFEIFGWRLESASYTVDEPNKIISGIGYGMTAADLLARIDVDGNANISVVDGSGDPVSGDTVVTRAHKVKAVCTQGTFSALYELEVGLIGSEDHLVDYGTKSITLLSSADITTFESTLDYDDAMYTVAFFDEDDAEIIATATALIAGMTVQVFAFDDVSKATPLDSYTISDEAVTAVSSVTLDQDALALTVNKTATLAATIAPDEATDKRLKWSSDNETVATVSSLGVVTALSVGSANVTVKSFDGLESATCAVTVGAKPNVTAVQAVNDRMMKPGGIDKLILPSTLTVTLNDGTTPSYPIVWDMAELTANQDVVGNYTVMGTITLPADDTVTNNTAIQAECDVEILEGLDPAGSTTTYIREEFTPVGAGANVAVFEFDVVIHQVNANSSILLTTAGSTKTSTSDYQIHIRTGSETASEFDAYMGSGGGAWIGNIKVPYIPGEVYHIRIESNAASKVYDAWVTAPDGTTTQFADGYGFRSTATVDSFGQVALGTSGTTPGRYTMFNFEAYNEVQEQIDSVTLSQATASLTVGDSLPLTAGILPDTAVNTDVMWSTTNASIATVADGVVTAVAAGRATIRATSVADTRKYDECEVTVSPVGAVIAGDIISVTPGAGHFPLAVGGVPATIWVDADDSVPVVRVVNDFRDDVERVTGLVPVIDTAAVKPAGPVVIVGTLDGSQAIQDLITAGDITTAEVAAIEGKWEAFLIKVIDADTLVVVGADPRGAVYGVYEISEQMGVNPWYYFADVAINTKLNVYVKAGTAVIDMPDVQYRGIFLNDEEKLSRWASSVAGDPNTMGPKTYAKIFELILRLKGNYMWAAMHVNSFNNVAANIPLIQEYGVVLGSSHCDMLLRTNVHEWNNWKNAYAAANGVPASSIHYDYTISKDAVLQYWRENAERHQDTEAQWTLGMRGPHDEPFDVANIMNPEYAHLGADIATRKANIVEEIIAEQQAILLDVLGAEKYAKAFMVMIPYKEVLPIYNHPEFELPDNVTVIWCDDNHSIMRRMPDATERARTAGHGIYYHVSYWAPADQSYMWLSSAPLSLIGSELDKSWEHNVRKAWVLNIGDIKPQEAEMTYFIRYGWDVEQYKNDADKFVEEWIGDQFGAEIGEEVADIQRDFYKHSNVRKVEHMKADVFNQTYYGDEGAKRMEVYQDLFDRAQAIYDALPAAQKLGFYELIQCKINWVYYVNKAYYYADKSNLAYDQGRMASADAFLALSLEADAAKKAEIAKYGTMNGGKWYNFIDPENAAPPVTPQFPPASPALVLGDPALGVVVEGEVLPQENSALTFSPYGQAEKFVDVFNKGAGTVNWTATASEPWVELSADSGAVYDEVRLFVSIDDIAGHLGESATITITDGTDSKIIDVTVENVTLGGFAGYVEADGYVSMQAEHYSSKADKGAIVWRTIKNLGRAFDGDVMQTYDPALGMIDEGSIAANAPGLTYDFYLTTAGTFPMEVYRVPTLNSKGQVRFAYSVDDGAPIVVSSLAVDEGQGTIWTTHLKEQIEKHMVTLPALTAGAHTITLWMVDNFISIDKMVIYTGADGALKTYLGPDESYHTTKNPVNAAGTALLDRVSVEAAPKDIPATWGSGAFMESGGKVSIEAEYAMEASYTMADTTYPADIDAYAYRIEKANKDGVPVAGWRLTQSPTGMAMRVPDVGGQWTEGADWKPHSPEMGYKVNFTTTGRYNLWVLWRFVDDASDSVRGAVDDANMSLNTGAFFSNNLDEKWHWKKISNDISGSSGGVNIATAGEHTIKLFMREDGVYIDRIYLTTGNEDPTSLTWMSSERSTPAPVDYPAVLKEHIDEQRSINFPIGTTPGNYLQADCDVFMGVLAAEEADAADIEDSAGYNAALTRIADAEAALKATLILTDGTADYVAYQQFEGYEQDKLPYGYTPSATTLTALANGATANVVEEDGNQFISLVTKSGAAYADFDWEFLTPVSMDGAELMVVEFSARMHEGLRYTNSFLPRIDGGGNYAMTVALDNGNSLSDKIVRVRNGGTAVDAARLTFGKWHNFRVVANRATDKYSVYLDGVLIANAFGFRTATGTNMTAWRFGIDNFVGRIDYDNMTVRLANLHDVSAATVTGGTIAVGNAAVSGATIQMAAGEAVAISLTPSADYRLKADSLKVYKTGDETTTVSVTNNSFVMPDYPVTIVAEFEAIDPALTSVEWSTLTANGVSDTTDTTELTLTFDVDPTGLAASDITVTGATKGALTGTETTRTLAISDITVANGADVTVELANPVGVTITPSSKTVAVYRALTDVAVTGVTLNKSAATLIVGGTETLTATVAPADATNKAVTWTSDTPAVATVSASGVVTAVARGSAAITVTTTDGSKTASCVVTVNADISAVSHPAAIEVEYGTTAAALAAELPANVQVTLTDGTQTSLAVVWDTLNYDGATAGDYTLSGAITLPVDGTITNNDSKTASITVTVAEDGTIVDPEVYNIASVGTLSPLEVSFGTAVSALNLPATVFVTLDAEDDPVKELPVVWNTSSYNGATAGDYTLNGAITLPIDETITNTDDLEASIVVTVLPAAVADRNIASVAATAARSVSFGTAASALNLPTTVEVTLDDASTDELAVDWDVSNYDGNSAGTYTLIGALVLKSGILNSGDLTASIEVTVRAKSSYVKNPQPTPPPAEPSAEINPEANVDKETGAASAHVDEKAIDAALDAAKKGDESAVVIKPEVPEGTDNVSVTIPAASADAIGEAKKSVTVDTPAAQVTIGSDGLTELADGAEQITVETSVDETGAITIAVKSDDTVVNEVSGGVSVTVPGSDLTDTTVIVLVNEDGSETILPKSIVTEGGVTVQLEGSGTIKIIDNAKQFDDVAEDGWEAIAVAFVAARELMSGTGEGTFSPNGGMTRGMLATVLHRLELKPESSADSSFSDVAFGSWYADAVVWAAETEIVTGVGGNMFEGDREISRAELVTMLYRYAKYAGLATEGDADLSEYVDGASVPDWSAEAFAWAVSAGIISGTDTGALLPNECATRAQVAKVMMEMVKLLAK